MLVIQSSVLKGSVVALEPLNESHQQDLFAAAQDERIWTFIGSKAYGDKFYSWFDKAMQDFKAKHQLPFVVRRLSDNKIIGSTRFYDIKPEHNRLTLGYTWYIPEVWGTAVNPESKLLMLQFAFETLNANRVEFMTDARNARSRAAIKKLGAIEEGLLRKHMVLADGYVRDTVVFGIIQSDWEHMKPNLQARVAKFNE